MLDFFPLHNRDERNELKARMESEKQNSRMNRLKIQNQWRKIMRLAKVESLRKDIEILSQNHERDVDRKDAIIQMLDRDLEEAEDQFQMALRAHLQNMDELIDLQDTRLLTLEQEFETELNTLETEFQAEKEMIVKQHALESTCKALASSYHPVLLDTPTSAKLCMMSGQSSSPVMHDACEDLAQN